MAQMILVLAGLFETGWAIGLKYTHGFTRPLPSALTVVAMIASFWLLSAALKTLPVGTAYAVWVGIGAVGTVLLGILLLHEPASVARMVSIALIICGIVGLKLATPVCPRPGRGRDTAPFRPAGPPSAPICRCPWGRGTARR